MSWKDEFDHYFRKYMWYFIAFLLGVLVCGAGIAISNASETFDPVVGVEIVSKHKITPDDLKWVPIKNVTGSGEIITLGIDEELIFGWIQDCPKHHTWHVVMWMGDRGLHLTDCETKEEAQAFLMDYAWQMYRASHG